jgi:SAM-dependent methyltransferase
MSKEFYRRVLVGAGIGVDDTVLVVCGGSLDRQVLLEAGARSVVISNLDYHAGVKDYSPYEWQLQDAEAIKADDTSFDWCVVANGLHHCASPHKALCELHRVARKGVVVLEARDSLLMRIAVRFGMTADYEVEPAALTAGAFGGYRNSSLPNYIYRWNEREVEKTVRSFAPDREPRIEYFFGYRLPLARMKMANSAVKRLAAKAAIPFVGLIEAVLPRQGNLFGFVIRKDGPLQPWLELRDGDLKVNLPYIYKYYSPSKYSKVETESDDPA